VSDAKSRGRTPGRPTSFDIANLAGVSQPTVSRALRGSASVSEATRRKVEAIARQLNYTVDKNASSLDCQHTNTLVLLFLEDPTGGDQFINPFFLAMLGAITHACTQRGYDLLISFQKPSSNWHRNYGDTRKADGIILLGYGDYLQYQSRLEQLASQGTHFVRWGAVLQGQPGLSVGCDNFRGGHAATQHLLKLGRRNIAFLGNAGNNCFEYQERYRGYAAALQEAGFNANPLLQVDGLGSEADGRAAAELLLKRQLPFDAVVAASDLLAIGAMRHLQEHGWQVPGQVAFVGFDDIPAASMASPPLTTVVQDTSLAGEVLVGTLLRLVGGEPAAGTLLPTRLVVRASCGS